MNMHEQISTESERQEQEDFNLLAEAAEDLGLKLRLPEKGTAAHERLYALAKKYSEATHRHLTDRTHNASKNGKGMGFMMKYARCFSEQAGTTLRLKNERLPRTSRTWLPGGNNIFSSAMSGQAFASTGDVA